MTRLGSYWRPLLAILLIAYLGTGLYHSIKALPDGISVATPLRAASGLHFLADYTFQDAQQQRRSEQVIFDEILSLIGQARRLVVLDMFLINDFAGEASGTQRRLSAEVTEALIQRRHEVPELQAVLITDPFNTLYNGVEASHLRRLEQAGIQVIITDLDALRASNPSWTALWRLCCQWFGNSPGGGWLPSPVGPEQVGLRTYLTLLNFNANHRKTLVVDQGETWVGLVTSGNPHDASSAHDNVALRFSGEAALDLLETERATARLSGTDLPYVSLSGPSPPTAEAGRLQILTEARIRDALIAAIDSALAGDELRVAVFYLAHRGVVQALKAAMERGVELRVLLDPNEDAFGRKKNGIPNRQVALELVEAGVPLRWCDTHGEQCHWKFLLLTRATGEAELILGSANFTRRNLDDYNLETSVRLLAPADTQTIREATAWFERYWHNEPQRHFSVPYEAYADPSRLRYWRYRFMEASGWSTF
ncbi:MAG: phospholipase D family protein [Thioalkalivibrio sp.]